MSSNINPYNINGAFPVAGQDNSSQGFRTNFTNTQNNFIFAAEEISELQNKAILTGALAGQTLNNDMAGTKLTRPQLAAWTQSLHDLGAVDTTAVLDFNVANFQKITTAGSITLAFNNWPATTGSSAVGYGVLRLWINVTDTTHLITLPDSVTIAVADISGYDSTTHAITFDSVGNYVFDFSSIDGGENYLIFDVVRNRASFRDAQLYFNNEVNPTFLIGYSTNSLPVAQALETGQDTVSARGSFNSVSTGVSDMGNIYTNTTDTFNSAGYSITGFRGNLETGTFDGIRSGDQIGYINSLTFTGNAGGSNVIQTTSSIGFYAKGTNVLNGLGGNVAIFTTPDGTGNNQFYAQKQAVGIENDQSTHFYGALTSHSGIVEAGTFLATLAGSGGTFTANANVSTVIIDSTGTITTATVIMPSSPVNGQRVRISSVRPITTSNVWAPDSAIIKYVPSTTFSSGNVSVSLTYMAGSSTWYRTT